MQLGACKGKFVLNVVIRCKRRQLIFKEYVRFKLTFSFPVFSDFTFIACDADTKT